jgi:uncharacterized protein YqjF (DUF2071 family)
MAARLPEHRVAVPVLGASWLTLAFLHWPFDPPAVQALLPEGLTVDEYDGTAWVSMAPFVMAGIRPAGLTLRRDLRQPNAVLPAGRYPPPSTPETNLRTYVRGPDGRDGLWFFSLDIGSSLLAAAIRGAVGAPYHPARLHVSREGPTVTYSGERPTNRGSYRLVLQPGDTLVPDELEIWLTSRWRAYTEHLGRLLVTPVSHEPWPLRTAQLAVLEQDLTDCAGLPDAGRPPLVHFSDGVRRVRIGLSRPARTRSAPQVQ